VAYLSSKETMPATSADDNDNDKHGEDDLLMGWNHTVRQRRRANQSRCDDDDDDDDDNASTKCSHIPSSSPPTASGSTHTTDQKRNPTTAATSATSSAPNRTSRARTSATGSRPAGKKKCSSIEPRRNVRFNPSVRFVKVRGRWQYTPTEAASVWFDQDEYDDIRHKMRKSVKRMRKRLHRSGLTAVSADTIDLLGLETETESSRGLEHLASNSVLELHRSEYVLVRRRVLSTQAEQRETGNPCEMEIARASRSVTEKSSTRAVRRAIQDTIDASSDMALDGGGGDGVANSGDASLSGPGPARMGGGGTSRTAMAAAPSSSSSAQGTPRSARSLTCNDIATSVRSLRLEGSGG
jgi:hypothetical protein